MQPSTAAETMQLHNVIYTTSKQKAQLLLW